jgi:hypothetical protein
LWGLPGDGPLRGVLAALQGRREAVYLLDQSKAEATSLDLFVGTSVSGALRIGEDTLALEAIESVYARAYDVRALPAMRDAGPETHLWRHGLSLEDASQAWVEVTPALVVNRPSAMAANGSKPFQAAQIRVAGFYVPETLITTDEAAVREFSDRHGSVIYKSVSGVRSIVSRLGPAHRGRLADVANCPTQFQEYIAGADFRVHVVGEAIFAAEIVSDADDYRYASRAGRSTRIRAFTLEPDLADRCRRFAAAGGGHRSKTNAGRALVLLRGQSVSRVHVLPGGDRAKNRAGDRRHACQLLGRYDADAKRKPHKGDDAFPPLLDVDVLGIGASRNPCATSRNPFSGVD